MPHRLLITAIRVLSLTTLYWSMAYSLSGQAIVYPERANVIDVTKAPYFADHTGIADATAAINQAMIDYNNSHTIIYLPAGTYRVTNTVEWGSPVGCNQGATYTCHRYTILAGAGRDLTTIKLDDNAPMYQDVDNPKLMVWTKTSAAMSFQNSVRNLTISTGAGNPGAHALGFEANNQGGIENVRIKSEDGQGIIGLHMGTGDQAGPCLIKDLIVDGFKWGIYTFANQNSIYFENIELLNQSEYGLYNRQQMISINNLQSTNEVPAIYNQKDGGSMITLINSTLTGVGAASEEIAFRNNNLNQVFLRNVEVTGYEYALQQLRNGFSLELLDIGTIAEYTTETPLHICDNVEQSLNLPIKERPTIIYEDTALWVSIMDYGAAIDNGFQGQGSTQDDTDAIQAAFDSGNSTILVPGTLQQFPQRFIAFDTITIPSTVKHIIGAKGIISGNVVFEILPGTDTLIVEDFAQFREINHYSQRVLVLKNAGIKNYRSLDDGTSGDVFIEDVVGGPYHFQNQDVWARQMNTEHDSVNIVNDGGNLWIFGMKTEKKGTAIRTINGGKTEVMGALFYGNTVEEAIPKPIFEVVESSFSISTFKELGYINDYWDVKVRETRNGQTHDYVIGNVPIRSSLFVAYPSAGDNQPPVVDAGSDQVIKLPQTTTLLDGYSNDDALPMGDCYTTSTWVQISGPSSFAMVDSSQLATEVVFIESGEYALELTIGDGAFTVKDTVTIYVYDHVSTTADHNEDGLDSGDGADANLRGWSNSQKNYGGTNSFGPRNYFQFPAKSIFRIDVSAFADEPIENARLELELATTNGGLIEDWTYNVFGLCDGDPEEDWIEGSLMGEVNTTGLVNYDNAPGFSNVHGGVYDPAEPGSGGVDHTKAEFLGQIVTREGVREKVSFSSIALQEFINADTSGTVTFLMTRESYALNTIVFASKEHESFAPPALYFDDCRSGATVYLDQSATGTKAGDNWQNAYTTLEEVFESPCFTAIDTILIAEGTYVPQTDDPNYTLSISHQIHMQGGYSAGGGGRDFAFYPTVISGNINDVNSDLDNIQTILTVSGVGAILSVDGVILEK